MGTHAVLLGALALIAQATPVADDAVTNVPQANEPAATEPAAGRTDADRTDADRTDADRTDADRAGADRTGATSAEPDAATPADAAPERDAAAPAEAVTDAASPDAGRERQQAKRPPTPEELQADIGRLRAAVLSLQNENAALREQLANLQASSEQEIARLDDELVQRDDEDAAVQGDRLARIQQLETAIREIRTIDQLLVQGASAPTDRMNALEQRLEAVLEEAGDATAEAELELLREALNGAALAREALDTPDYARARLGLFVALDKAERARDEAAGTVLPPAR